MQTALGAAQMAITSASSPAELRKNVTSPNGTTQAALEVFDRAQKRINQGLSICIFPEGGVPDDESVLLDTFKDGAFRLALEHKIPIAPVTFGDNKRRFSYTFFSGSPGLMRVKMHSHVATDNESLDRKTIREEVREVIYTQLLEYESLTIKNDSLFQSIDQ